MPFLRKLELYFFEFIIILLVSLKSLFVRVRMSHENGVAARGRLRIVDNPTYPVDEFFTPGREFPCRLRHASVSYMDDARLVARGASIKFADADFDSPLDLLMNSGSLGPFHNVWTFFQFMVDTIRGRDPYIIPYLRKYPEELKGIEQALRYPDSFTDCYYASKVPFTYTPGDGILRYVRFRLIPPDRRPDAGFATEEEMLCFWRQLPRPWETRSPNYLKEEYESRLAKENVGYVLQMQLYEPTGDKEADRRHLSAVQPWDEPWHDLANVVIDSALDYEAGNRMWFHTANHPRSMGVVEPTSIHDPASLNHLRGLGMWPRRARFLGYRLFGMPKPIPDARTPLEPQTGPEALYLPQNEDEAMRARRAFDLELARARYQYSTDRHQPAYVRKLPAEEAFRPKRRRAMKRDMMITLLDGALVYLGWFFRRKHQLSAYDLFYLLRERPAVADRFMNDLEFGRQRLNGINPMRIRRCTEIPANFPVTEETLRGLLDGDDTLEGAMAAGRVYIVDYRIMAALKVVNGYPTGPVCLLYVDHADRLRPVAIQLGSGDKAPVFTPHDSFWLWLTVKTYFQSADAGYHEIVSHLLKTHLVSETFAVATARHLHRRHPLSQLMTPYFRYTMAINAAARAELFAPGGPIDKTMGAGYAGSVELMRLEFDEWSFDAMSVEHDLEARGVGDPEKLPGFYWRDDARLLWGCVEQFVREYVDFWYPSQDELEADYELAAWCNDLASRDYGRVQDFPEVIEDKARLTEVVTRIIYNASAEHCAVNNGQYEMYGYIPNVPGAMYKPPPDERCQMDEGAFVDALPSFGKTVEQLALIHLLSVATDVPLGSFHDSSFANLEEVMNIVKRFRKNLAKVTAKIDRRNLALQVPYHYLRPPQVSESINT